MSFLHGAQITHTNQSVGAPMLPRPSLANPFNPSLLRDFFPFISQFPNIFTYSQKNVSLSLEKNSHT